MKRLICFLFHGHRDRMMPIHSVSRCRKCLVEWSVRWELEAKA